MQDKPKVVTVIGNLFFPQFAVDSRFDEHWQTFLPADCPAAFFLWASLWEYMRKQ